MNTLVGAFSVRGFAAALAAAALGGCQTVDTVEPPPFTTDIFDTPAPVTDRTPARFGAAREAAGTVTPVFGGTLLVLANGRTAVASDPDFDRVWVTDLEAGRTLGSVALQAGDEPGRVVEDADGRVHVALRRGGALVSIDVAGLRVTDRRAVCAAPRGVAFERATGLLHVACAGGELVSLPAAGGAITQSRMIVPDLRDVVVAGNKLLVSSFRSAEVIAVDSGGPQLVPMPSVPSVPLLLGRFPGDTGAGGPTVARARNVAWRMVASGDQVFMLHQLAQDRTLGTQPARGGVSGGYGVPASRGNEEPPPAVIEPGITIGSIASEGGIAFGQTAPVRQTSLSVDMAVSARSNRVAVVSPGNQLSLFPQVVTGAWHRPTSAQDTGIADGRILVRSTAASQIDSARVNTPNTLGGQAVAVAFDGRDRVVVQTRAPSRIVVIDGPVMSIGDEVRRDTGQEVFHAMTDSFLACASCHPEGGDDGRVWTFEGIGRRRTPPVRGGIMDTAPFHWDGDMRSFAHLTSEVFTGRMAGNQLTPEQGRALEHWIDRVPSVPVARPADTASVARGEALFRSDEVGCAGCHSGAKFTNNQTVDVGTGSAFQVPTLVGLASRGSLMHDGCATTLRERFTNTRCGGGDAHGHTTQLDAAQLGDLVAYLRTL